MDAAPPIPPIAAPAGPPCPGASPASPLGFAFDTPVPPGGYLWWYIDAISDDGAHAITLIAFVGSVFSPYYAWSGYRRPEEHCALNVAVYGRPSRWAMTERGSRQVRRTASQLQLGPSRVYWDGGALHMEFNEIGGLPPRQVRGRVRLQPQALPGQVFALDRTGRHLWQPVAPRARIDVELHAPRLRWQGDAYHDTNYGQVPVAEDFAGWSWGRVTAPDSTSIFYDCRDKAAGPLPGLALCCDASGRLSSIAPPALHDLPPGFWGVGGQVRSDAGCRPIIRRRLEDAPFYTRSELTVAMNGLPSVMLHETLDARRLSSPIVRAMLPFRMPRAL